MKIKALALLIIASIVFLVSCQATPEDTIVFNKSESAFEEAIRNVIAAYDEDGLFYVECRAVEEIEGDIAYEDTWQVIAWQ